MPTSTAPKRKSRTSLYRKSALMALRASGMVGMFVGAPDLASSRKRILKEKLRGKTGAAG